MALTNISKPTTSLTNFTKISITETWGSNTSTWGTETRTWAATISTISDISKPVTSFVNVVKPT